jgi:hypothetical protein
MLLLLLLLQMKLGVWGKYKCGHNIILAHAKTMHMYSQKYKATQNGKFSIALDGKWGYAKDPNNPEGTSNQAMTAAAATVAERSIWKLKAILSRCCGICGRKRRGGGAMGQCAVYGR